MKLKFVFNFLSLIYLVNCFDKVIDIYKKDIFSIFTDDLLSYDSIEDNFSFQQTDKLNIEQDSSIGLLQISIGDQQNENYKIIKIHNIAEYKNNFALLVDIVQNDEVQINTILYCQLLNYKREVQGILKDQIQAQCNIQEFQNEDYLCGKMQIDSQFIYAPCISLIDSTFLLCKKNYKEDTISQCLLFKTEIQLSLEQLENEELVLQKYENKTNDQLFLLYFKNSKINYYHNRFFLIRENKFELMNIPVKNFVIGKIQTYSYIKNYDRIMLLITNISGFQQDLLMLKIEQGFVDKNFLKNSVIKTNIRYFHKSQNNIIIIEEDQASSVLSMTLLQVNSSKNKKIQIQNINYLQRTIYKEGICVLETLNDTNQKKFYMFNSFTQRYFEIKQTNYTNSTKIIQNAVQKIQDYQWWFVLSFANRNFFIIFDPKINYFRLYTIQDVKYVKLSLYNQRNEEKQQVATFKDGDQQTASLTINFCEFSEQIFDIKNQYIAVPNRLSKQNLKIYGNNLDLGDEISFFNELQIDIDYGLEVDNDIKNCIIKFETLNPKVYLMFCLNGKMIAFFDIFITRNKLKLSNYKVYETNLYSDINSIKIYQNEALIVITNNQNINRIYYAKFTKTEKEQNYIKFIKESKTHMYKNQCYFLSHGICCYYLSTNKRVVFDYQFDYNNFKLKAFYKEQIDKETQLENFNSFNNSFINKQKFSYIRKDEFLENFLFIVKENNQFIEKMHDFQIERNSKSKFSTSNDNKYFLNHKSSYYYISTHNHVVVTQKEPKLLFYGIYEGSIIFYPNQMKNYKSFYKITRDPRENLFLITYFTTEGHFRGSLYKSNPKHVQNRLIKDFLIEEQECVKPHLQTKLLKFQYLFMSICSNRRQNKRLWKYNLLGPLINIDGQQTQTTININKNQHQLNIVYRKLYKKMKLIKKPIKIYEIPKEIFTLDLEKDYNLVLNGDFRNIVQLDNQDKAQIQGRDKFVEDIQLLYLKKGFRVQPDVYMTFEQQKPLLLFGNYIYQNKKLDINYRYTKCRHIRPNYFENKMLQFVQKLFLCVEKNTLTYKITDFIDIHVDFPQELQTSNPMYAPQMIQVGNRIYFFFKIQLTGKTMLILRSYYKIQNNETFIYIEKVSVFNADYYTEQFSPIHQYYCFYNSVLNSIMIILHPYNSEVFYLLRLNLVDNQIDQKDTKKIWFTETSRIQIYRCHFTQQEDQLNFIASSEYVIYEFKLWYTGKWEYELVESFLNPMGNLKGEELLSKNKNYTIMLFNVTESKQNIIVWKRNQGVRNIPIFTTIAQTDFKLTKYKISNVDIVYDQKDQVDYIYITYFKAYNKDKKRYHALYLSKVQIGNISLQIQSSKFKFKQSITLRVYQFDNNFVQFEMPIKFKEKTKLLQFQIMFYFLLFLVFVFAGVLANFIYTNFQIDRNIKIWQAKQRINRENEGEDLYTVQSNFE